MKSTIRVLGITLFNTATLNSLGAPARTLAEQTDDVTHNNCSARVSGDTAARYLDAIFDYVSENLTESESPAGSGLVTGL